MKKFFNKSFWIYDAEVTVKECILGSAIIFILLTIGLLISDKIYEAKLDAEKRYNIAIKINDNADLFTYGMETDIGDAFVYGTLKAVDTVSYPEITGNYMFVKKVKEKYTMHTRQVAHTRTVNGKTQTYYTTETYWTWDYAGEEHKKSKQIQFLNSIFNTELISLPSDYYITTVKESSHVRYKYYGVDTEHKGTIFTTLYNNTITPCEFYKDMDIERTVEYLKFFDFRFLFWFIWIILICGAVYAFVYAENNWMN